MTKRVRVSAMAAFAAAILLSALAFAMYGEGKAPSTKITADSIGWVDYAKAQEKYPDFIQVKELRDTYDAELNKYANEQRKAAESYYLELERKKDEDSKGKTEAQRQTIERKYEKLAQDKAAEVKQAVQARMKELQDKLQQELIKADESLRRTIETVGAEKGVNLVLVKSAVYYGGVDLTEDVIAKANRTAKDKAKK